MATGVSGFLPSYFHTAYTPSQYGFGLYTAPHYVEEYNQEENYSIIKIDYINFTNSYYEQWTYWSVSGTININGKDYSYSGTVDVANYTAYPMKTSIVSDPIYHDSDGTKTITITLKKVSATGSTSDSAFGTSTGTLSTKSIALTNIHQHSYSSSITTPATCTSTGIKTYTCGCGKSYTETIAALGHNYQFSKTVAPTCTTQGYDIYICKNDTSHTEKRNYTDMIGHSYGAVVVQPTCTKQGYTDHICKNCGHIYTDTYVEPLGHSWGEWEVTVEPQYQKEGEASRFCPVCQTTEKKILAALQEALRRALIKIQNNNFIANIAMKDEEGKIVWFKFLPRIGN